MAYTIQEPEVGMIVYKIGSPQYPGKIMEIVTKGKTRVRVRFLNGKEDDILVRQLRMLKPHVDEMRLKLARHEERLAQAEKL